MSRFQLYTLCALVSLNVFLLGWHMRVQNGVFLKATGSNVDDIAGIEFIGRNYPLELPIPHLDLVAMSLHETVRFALNDSDGDAEWYTTIGNPLGSGRVRLGSNDRVFLVTFYHQIHCLRKMQDSIFERSNSNSERLDPIAIPMHTVHCLNYLKQTLLCEAADSLEEGDFMERDFEHDRMGGTLVCKDWEALYASMGEMFETWLRSEKHDA